MLAIVRTCAILGLDGCTVEVQTDFNPRAGIPHFTIVGLPDSAVKESRDRVRAAIKNSGLQFPNSSQESGQSLPLHLEKKQLEEQEQEFGLQFADCSHNTRFFVPARTQQRLAVG
jgi:hypothetical protein